MHETKKKQAQEKSADEKIRKQNMGNATFIQLSSSCTRNNEDGGGEDEKKKQQQQK